MDTPRLIRWPWRWKSWSAVVMLCLNPRKKVICTMAFTIGKPINTFQAKIICQQSLIRWLHVSYYYSFISTFKVGWHKDWRNGERGCWPQHRLWKSGGGLNTLHNCDDSLVLLENTWYFDSKWYMIIESKIDLSVIDPFRFFVLVNWTFFT